jgi:hypothetical protein
MRPIRRALGVATTAILALSFVSALPHPARAASEWDCPAGSNPAVWDPAYISTPIAAKTLWGRKIELRYHSRTRCAWGRISNGSRNDSVWVDWSKDGGRNWRQLGVTEIPWSGTQVYTPAYNDRGYVMRACGKAGDRVEIACTGWW